MATYDYDLTGEGVQAFGTFESILNLSLALNAAGPLVTYYSGGDPKRLLHCGWIGLGQTLRSPLVGNYISWWKYIEMEREIVYFGFSQPCMLVVWHLAPGCTVHITLNS